LIIVKTPLRVSFFGGGTDFPDYFNSSEGMVIGSTIDKFIFHTVSTYSKRLFDNSIRFSYNKIEFAKTLSDIQHEPFKKILNFMKCDQEIEVNLASDLPSFSGMGSSSSFSVGLINGLNSFLKNKNRD
jgi:D-glycero-alpha-D-manno-heptose-7-phosphate kinase